MHHRLSCVVGLILFGLGAWAVRPATAASSAWDHTLPARARFIVLSDFGNDAVLDRETRLVWERSPSTSTFEWNATQAHCNRLNVGNRLGWRLPTIQELASLVDPTAYNLALPSGHPFTNVRPTDGYDSITTMAGYTDQVWCMVFLNGNAVGCNMFLSHYAWFVRGGDTQ